MKTIESPIGTLEVTGDLVPVVKRPDGITMAFLHYSQDPEKDAAWAREHKSRSDAFGVENWDQEMELNFQMVTGKPVCERFSLIKHVREDLRYDESLPLILSCDWGVEPMAWVIGQPHGEEMYWLDEVWLQEGDLITAADEFISNWGEHQGELWIMGDPAGNARSQKNRRSNYDDLRIHLNSQAFRMRVRVLKHQPAHKALARAFNHKLMNENGEPLMWFSAEGCPQLVRDCTAVVWHANGERVLKERSNKKNPYFYRGHALDAALHAVHRLWPIRSERQKVEDKDSQNRKSLGRIKVKKKPILGIFGKE